MEFLKKNKWNKSAFLFILLLVAIKALSEGTPQVMPNTTNGVALYVANGSSSGPYRGAAIQNNIRFRILDHNIENLYFGIRAFNRAATPAQVQPYYRIVNAAGTQIVAPTQILTAQQIGTHAQTVAGPNIGGAVPTGYTPLLFNPSANGEYFIELYVSGDAGATATANQTTVFTLFDFTVATAANVKYPGRIYSQAWSFITYNPVTNVAQINNSLEGDFYAYTSDGTVNKLDFLDGFRPFGFILYMNRYGAVNGTNWVNDRRSQNTGATAPSLANGYNVFLNIPDAISFPVSPAATSPQFAGKVYSCAPSIYIPLSIDRAGDIAILLDINGTSGYQAGTSDRYLFVYDATVGRNVAVWDGLDGLGNLVTGAVNFDLSIFLRVGRTNVPMFDAELNTNGITVTGISPLSTNPKLYWNDLLLANAGTVCDASNANNNLTGTGIENSVIGSVSPGRAWDGPGAGLTVPAPNGGQGSATLTLNCDDYGNVRTLNSWYYSYEVASANYLVSVPGCSVDGDPVADATDIDDDNDGIPDITESNGVNPDADADADGIPNYLDPTPGAGVPAFVDANNDGVNDAYDTDGDGIINSKDLDSDNDGIPDIVEAGGIDTNGDGRVDVLTDTDGDGLANTYDTTNGGVNIANLDTDGDGVPNFTDLDSDNDGIPDVVEAGGTDANNDGKIDGFTDTDSDGFAQSVDGDTNNDGTAENTAGALIITSTVGGTPGRPASYPRANQDATGLPNPYDLDSDNDGILDVREAGLTDATNDGIADGTLGADGWSDTVDALVSLNLPNTDGSGRPNYLDIDSDNDGIVDNVEGQTTAGYIAPSGADTDNDGIDDAYDNNDAAFAGGANNGIAPTNSDAADVADYLDLDADNDGYPDFFEGHDSDGNNLPDAGSPAASGVNGGAADIDGDGLLDGYDNNTASVDATNGTNANSYPDLDGGTTERDWREIANTDAAGPSNFTDVDDDNDGIPDLTENGGFDALADTDADGVLNYIDATPGAGQPAFVDTNNDGVNDFYDNDLDGIINSLDLDSDNDGIADLVEAGGIDTNGDGRVDILTDTDGDGLVDTYDTSNGGVNIANLDTDGDGIANFKDLDSDNDGLPDVVEAGGTDANNDGKIDGYTDNDGDGFAQSVDGDTNNDGTAENTAGALIITSTVGGTPGRPASYPRANADENGLPNPYDLDADGDGILDTRETGIADTNNDGIADGTLGADGWSDTVDALPTLTPTNTDGSGRANYLDIDADDDGIVDNIEGQSTFGYIAPAGADSDNDGIDNAYDNNDAAYAGSSNNGIAPNNQDGTDNPDYTDNDTDNDGKTDALEGWDTNGNGVIDGLERTGGAVDADNDGLLDGYDNNTAASNPTNGTTPMSYPDVDLTTPQRAWREPVDSDLDGILDGNDLDDDNDGIPDTLENPGGFAPNDDADSDGIPNFLDTTPGAGLPAFTDTNSDGINDAYDTDKDGVMDLFDLDADNDGIPDIIEAGGVDTNGDGRIDGPVADADGDGLLDAYDPSTGGNAIANRDTDGDGVPNRIDLDSDNDGIPDVVEAGGTDANNDGRIDGFTDTDNDGFAQAVDGDANNDGTAENTAGALIITGADTNADGQPNSYPRANTDRTGLPNPYDLDADGDGILDTREAGLADTNNDGIADGTLGADGWSDTVDGLVSLNLPNTDGRGPVNYLDIDADDDGLTDNVEGQSTAGYQLPSGSDADNDGIDDVYDNNDAAFAGNASNGITPYNHDGLDNPDYTDTDSDNDGVNDLKEGTGNTSATLTNTADTDGDGLVDQFDIFDLTTETASLANNVTIAGMGNGGSSTGPTPAGSNVLGNQTASGAPNRDWRNSLLVLPVTFINVTATISGNVTTVSWKVADEINVKEYIVERSTDGINYTTVGTVAFKNNYGAEQTYQFNDVTVAASNAVVHYRIKQVDADNKFTYSKIVTIRRGGDKNALKVLGNPVQNNQVLMQVTSNQPGNGTFMLMDINGRVLSTTTQSLSKGDNSIRLAPQNGLLVKGTYIIRAIINGQLFTEKINVIQ